MESLHTELPSTPRRRNRAAAKVDRAGQDDATEAGSLSSSINMDQQELENLSGDDRNGGVADGHHSTNGSAAQKRASGAVTTAADPRIDSSGNYEFGGPWGVSLMMVGFPLLMWYMWIGATYYDGQLPLPRAGESWAAFARHLAALVYEGAFPTARAWAMYWGFLLFEAACYVLLPGATTLGKPLPHEGGRQLTYHCSGAASLYATIAAAAALHLSGIFPLYTLLDEYGPLLSVAILSGFGVAVAAYASALARGAQHRMTGSLPYDFFMGAELNPRLFGGRLDLKMFFEIRLPWYMLFLISASAAARQYEQYGWVSGELCFVLMAHFLYAMAPSKGEEFVPPTWDIFWEKWGFMLIFWNMAGVPLTYCHCTIYLANNAPSVYRWNRAALAFFYVSYLFAYWVWDTAGSQKNRFRQTEHGGVVPRRFTLFPQLPWQTLTNPKTLRTEDGGTLLVDGWYAYARKIHYTCDMYFALMWALVTGFGSPLPWFYPVFFAIMIAHRAHRDIQRCEAKYGATWLEYKRRVPYLFIPYVF